MSQAHRALPCPKEKYPMNVITDALACIAHFLGWLI
jgi:hypothetical protein